MNNSSLGISRKKYLEMRRQMLDIGAPAPPLEDAPDSIENFPPLVGVALSLYNYLADKYVSDGVKLIYTGKDYSCIKQYFEIYDINCKEDQKVLLKLLAIIDRYQIKKLNKKSPSSGR